MNDVRPDEHDYDESEPELDEADVDEADADDADVDETDVDETEETDVEVAMFDDHVDFDITSWSGESRKLLDSMLTTDGIDHIWQGTTLSVRVGDEDATEALIETVDQAGHQGLDTDRSRVAYEVGAWSAAMQTSLAEALGVAEIPFEWDERGDLVVYEDDEEMVEEILDAMPDPDDPDAVDADGVDVQAVLSRLWEASRTLARRPTDSDAVLVALAAAGEIRHIGLPFGFEPVVWRDLVSRADALHAALDSEDPDAQMSDDELQEACVELEARLHPLVAGPDSD